MVMGSSLQAFDEHPMKARATDGKSGLALLGSSDALFLDERILRGGKTGQLFRTMR
jgi:hypothetical protein